MGGRIGELAILLCVAYLEYLCEDVNLFIMISCLIVVNTTNGGPLLLLIFLSLLIYIYIYIYIT